MSLFRFLFLSAALLHGRTQDKLDTLCKPKLLSTHTSPPPPFLLNCNLVVEKHVNFLLLGAQHFKILPS